MSSFALSVYPCVIHHIVDLHKDHFKLNVLTVDRLYDFPLLTINDFFIVKGLTKLPIP